MGSVIKLKRYRTYSRTLQGKFVIYESPHCCARFDRASFSDDAFRSSVKSPHSSARFDRSALFNALLLACFVSLQTASLPIPNTTAKLGSLKYLDISKTPLYPSMFLFRRSACAGRGGSKEEGSQDKERQTSASPLTR